MASLFGKLRKSDNQCEHKCIVGLKAYKKENEQVSFVEVYDGDILRNDDAATTVELFNFCPRCGQQLNTETKLRHNPFIVFETDK